MFFIKKERVGKGYHLYKGASVLRLYILISINILVSQEELSLTESTRWIFYVSKKCWKN